jgi:hypothetical protein
MNITKPPPSVSELFDLSVRCVRRLERHALATGRCVDCVRALTLAPLSADNRAAVIRVLAEFDSTFKSDAIDVFLAELRKLERAILETPRIKTELLRRTSF